MDNNINFSNLPKFISFEGGEGCGKTTQSKRLYQYLLKNEIDTIWTREIGGTEIGEAIRDLVVHSKMLPTTELLLILAARSEHIRNLIIPSLKEGKIVICDRFIDSSAAYQSNSDSDINKIFDLNEMLFEGFLPDKTILLKVDSDFALKRAKERGSINKFEMKEPQFHTQVAKNYDLIAKKNASRIITIDASKDSDEIFNDILRKLTNK